MQSTPRQWDILKKLHVHFHHIIFQFSNGFLIALEVNIWLEKLHYSPFILKKKTEDNKK